MIISEKEPTVALVVGIGVLTALSTVVEVPFEMENISAKHRYITNNLAVCLSMLNEQTFNLT